MSGKYKIVATINESKLLEFLPKQIHLLRENRNIFTGPHAIRVLECLLYLKNRGGNVREIFSRLTDKTVLMNIDHLTKDNETGIAWTSIYHCLGNLNNNNKFLILRKLSRDFDILGYKKMTNAKIAACDTDFLFMAIEAEDEKFFKELLEKNPDLEIKNEEGLTPLMQAAWQCNYPMLECLIKLCPLVNMQDQFGYSPLMLALDGMSKKTENQEKIVDLLINAGANLELKNMDDCTALMIAVIKGYKRIVKHLIDKGAKLNQVDNIGYDILGLAILHKHPEIIKIILGSGRYTASPDEEFWEFLELSKHSLDKSTYRLLQEYFQDIYRL
ncbi:MAG: ankyrin repeat domain-containing protein [Candidatus Margulisbacteria bacterium]|nr:ankyrin repeat domain-containing protein [Candidatus Margulisiibacteriota bacterium]